MLYELITHLIVSNRYHDILMDPVDSDVDVTLYSGELTGSAIGGNFSLNLKYGTARLGACKRANLDIYDSKIFLENTEDLTLKSRYSRMEIGNAGHVIADSYDDDIILGEINVV